MGNNSSDKPEAVKIESKILKAVLLVSFVLHITAFFLNPSRWLEKEPPRLEEWSIEADITGFEIPKGEENNPSKSERTEEEKKRMLPQLPKKFAVKDEQEDVQGLEGKSVPEEVDGDQPDKKTDDELAASQAKPEDAATKLFKEELIERLKKEQERQEKLAKEKAEKEKQKIASMLEKRKGELAGQSDSIKGGKVTKNHPYIVAVTDKIRRTYSLPGVYRIESGQMPILVIVIGKSGKIEELTLYQSSNNVAMDKLALKTVQDAAPFPIPPKEIWGKPIRFRFDPTPM